MPSPVRISEVVRIAKNAKTRSLGNPEFASDAQTTSAFTYHYTCTHVIFAVKDTTATTSELNNVSQDLE